MEWKLERSWGESRGDWIVLPDLAALGLGAARSKIISNEVIHTQAPGEREWERERFLGQSRERSSLVSLAAFPTRRLSCKTELEAVAKSSQRTYARRLYLPGWDCPPPTFFSKRESRSLSSSLSLFLSVCERRSSVRKRQWGLKLFFEFATVARARASACKYKAGRARACVLNEE